MSQQNNYLMMIIINNNNNVLRPRVNPRKTSYYYYYTKYIYLVMVFHITTFNVSQALIIYITCISPILTYRHKVKAGE
jgi:hypothetical protein